MLKKGDQVEILPEFQDEGDNEFIWLVLEDEEKGRVDICPVNIGLQIKPRYTVEARQIRLARPRKGAQSVDVQTLALEFSAALRALLSEEDMRSVILKNAAESDARICHSHDFCDANVVMHEVFLAHGMDPADEGGLEKWGGLWSEAWNLAKDCGFDIDLISLSRSGC